MPLPFGEDDLYWRAVSALARRAARHGFIFDQPSYGSSRVTRNTVTLRNSHRLLARYRIIKRKDSDDVRLAWKE